MIALACQHPRAKKFGKDRHGNQRFRCLDCGRTFMAPKESPLGAMRIPLAEAKMILRLLVEGNSVRATERITGIHRDTICRLLVHVGEKCAAFLDKQMRGLTLSHLEFDEQWTYVYKKQSRIPVNERQTCYGMGDVYLWTCIDQQTKLMPAFRIGKRSADNARRFAMDVAGRLAMPKPYASDAHDYKAGGYRPIVQVSMDGFKAYPEAIDLAFGPYARYGTIIKEYRSARMEYTPSEMVGTVRTGIRGISPQDTYSICTSHG